MESKKSRQQSKIKVHPQEHANFLSDLFYCWTVPIFKAGLKKEFSEEDIYQTLEKHDANTLVANIEKAWNEEVSKSSNPSLWKVMFRLHKWDLLQNMGIYFFINFILDMSGPIALGRLMGYYVPGQTEISRNEAIICASIIVLSGFVSTVFYQFWVIHFKQIWIKCRVELSSLIYKKSLKLSHRALQTTSVGHIINLMANDVTRFKSFWEGFNGLWSCPLQTAVILFLLYYLAGPTALVGLAFIGILTPLQFFLSKKSAFYRLKIAQKADERIRSMSEIISGISVIKLYAWEKSFVKLIDLIRRKEVHFLKIANYLDFLNISFCYFIDRVAIFLCILTYVLTGNVPNGQYVFVVSAFYYMLMESVSFNFPEAVSETFQLNVSLKRFEKFLMLEEIKNEVLKRKTKGLTINSATAKWSENNSDNTLSKVNINANLGEIVALIGPIGSGKSSLLNLCLGELPLREGYVEIGGQISYANQEPWLFAGTIRQNILFGESMDHQRYKEVIKVCALEQDIKSFPNGDNSIVGEKGILLSGGQKARINLARAVYKNADIYLLDDPLSAVDASVGKQIYNNCILNFLKGKCRVLVTHQVQYLASAHKIYLITNGAVAVSGTYKELQNSGETFTNVMVNHHEEENVSEVEKAEQEEDETEVEKEEEYRKPGKVSRKVYISYIRASSSYFGCFILALLIIGAEVLGTGSDYFITYWINLEQSKAAYNDTLESAFEDNAVNSLFTEENCLYFYTTIIIALIITALASSASFVRSCMKASISLHNIMFKGVVHATMNFFYKNTSGRILNRFSRDINCLDETLPSLTMDCVQSLLHVVITVAAICLINPWTLIPTTVIFVVMLFIRRIFLSSSRSIKRMESIKRSPIFSHLTESMKGLTTIRAFGASRLLETEFDNYQNVHTSVDYMFIGINRAITTWLDSACAFYVLSITVVALTKETQGGNVGFIITQGLNLTVLCHWFIRKLSELENEMTSVERVLEYTDLAQEHSSGKNFEPVWPKDGMIEFRSVQMRYSKNDPYVLKNLNFVIKPNEKVGVVGRTGAGKSSLIAVLFRLVNFEGSIRIDDIDTKTIDLTCLRSKISIIPQDPVIFSGTIRKNLDPFDEYSDEKIWESLENVELKEYVSKLSSGLTSKLSEGGSNFSVGQKQLICLARALLRNNKILMLDEATANVDPQTDELLQKTIRTNFKHCTVLTIAHRLHTVMDSDKILVMSDGCAVEYDHPHTLLEKRGVFYDLVMETGEKVANDLKQLAQKSSKY